MKPCTQCVKVTAQPNKYDWLVQQLQESSNLLKDVPECIYYLIGRTEEPNTVCIVELWTSKEAKDAFGAKPEVVKELKDTFMSLVASIDRPTTATIIGGVGI